MYKVRIRNGRGEVRQEVYSKADRRAVKNYAELAVRIVKRSGLSGVCYVEFLDVAGSPVFRVERGECERVTDA